MLRYLRQREVRAAPPGSAVNRCRQAYLSLSPSINVAQVQAPECTIRKFIHHGQLLVCFSHCQLFLLVYRYKGLNFCVRTDPPWPAGPEDLPEEAKHFEGYFTLLYCKRISEGEDELLCKDFCLVLNDAAYLVLASATKPEQGEDPNLSLTSCLPVVNRTTLHLVRLCDGEVQDRMRFDRDLMHLSHNAAASLHDHLILLLAIRTQTMHLVQVVEPGVFQHLREIGPHCMEDDQLCLSTYHEAELRFQARLERERKHRNITSSSMSLEHHFVPTIQPTVTQPAPQQIDPGNPGVPGTRPGSAAAQNGREPPRRVTMERDRRMGGEGVSSGSSAGASASENVSHWGESGLVTGLKQRLLVFLYHRAHRQCHRQGDMAPLCRFHANFNNFLNLVITKAQLFDRSHLLIKYVDVKQFAQRSSSAAAAVTPVSFCLYNLDSHRVVDFLSSSDDSLHGIFKHFADYFCHLHPDQPPWDRYISTCSNNIQLQDLLHNQTSSYGNEAAQVVGANGRFQPSSNPALQKLAALAWKRAVELDPDLSLPSHLSQNSTHHHQQHQPQNIDANADTTKTSTAVGGGAISGASGGGTGREGIIDPEATPGTRQCDQQEDQLSEEASVSAPNGEVAGAHASPSPGTACSESSDPLDTSNGPPQVKRDARLLGNHAFNQGRFSEAVEWYTRGITARPQDPRLFCNRALALLQLAGPTHLSQAVLDARRALELRPQYPKAFLHLARALTGLGEFSSASRVLKAAQVECPQHKPLFQEEHHTLLQVAARVENGPLHLRVGGQEEDQGGGRGVMIDSAAPDTGMRKSGALLGRCPLPGLEYEVFPPHPAALLLPEKRRCGRAAKKDGEREEEEEEEKEEEEEVAELVEDEKKEEGGSADKDQGQQLANPAVEQSSDYGDGGPLGSFVVPVGLPGCMRPHTPQEHSALHATMAKRGRSEKLVVAVPLEGLCNRLRVLVSAMALSDDMGRRLLVVWEPSPECCCKFQDLFQDHPGITLVAPTAVPRGGLEICQPKEALTSWRQLANVRYTECPERYAEYEEADVLVFQTCEEFYPGGGAHVESGGDPRAWMGMAAWPQHPHRSLGFKLLNSLKPTESITARVKRLPALCCGVHIRRTDNFHAWHSPLRLFFAAMEMRIDREPRTMFFLSTDDAEVEALVQQRYGKDLVLVYPKRELNRRNPVAIEDALIDLLHLAQTEEIIGSYWSSFTEVASLFRMQPLGVVYRELDTNDPEMVARALKKRVKATAQYPY